MKEENKENINDYERNYYNLKDDKAKIYDEDVLFQKKKQIADIDTKISK